MSSGIRRIFGIGMSFLPAIFILTLAGCGGGTAGTGTAGSTVNVSLAAAAPNAALNPADSLSAGLPAIEPSAASPAAENIDHVWVTIRRVSLIPGNDAPGPDPNGETAVQDVSPPDASGHISADLAAPEEVDLLNLPAGGVARFLNAIPSVPAGTYGKIRLFYSDPKVHFIGAADNTTMHGTANFHLDIHFVGGKLVIPESTGGGVQLHEVTVNFVLGKRGLKITVGPNNILMRPQVFATVSVVRFVLTGTVDNVDKASSTFDLATDAGRVFHIAYDNLSTRWAFQESGATPRAVAIDNQAFAIAALNDGATVAAIGAFSTGGLFQADDVTITFPVTRTGTVVSGTAASGWLADNTFVLGVPIDNVVTPKPSRESARYDNNADLSLLSIGQAAIVNGAVVTARGYAVPGGTEAYWISVGP